MFQHTHAGLTFNRNGDSFVDSYLVMKSNEKLLGNWTEIIFSTNWHPDPKKGFMKVWIDKKLKVDFKGVSNTKKGNELSLRYGLYSSSMSRYKTVFQKQEMPQRIIFFDGVKDEKNDTEFSDYNNEFNSDLEDINCQPGSSSAQDYWKTPTTKHQHPFKKK